MASVERIKEILIEEVKKVPAIWDKGHRNHHNRYHLEKQWKKISQDVGITDSRARKTWKNLRQEFGKQMTKALKADCTLESLHSEWPFFQQLMFLRDQFTNKKPNEDLALPFKIEDNDEFDLDSRGKMGSTDVAEGMDIPTPSPAGSSRESSPSPSLSPLLSSDSAGVSSSVEVQQKKRKKPPELNSRKKRRKGLSRGDEDVGFFNSLLPHVKRLSPQQKLLFRLKVQQYLYDLSYGYNSTRQNILYDSSNLSLYPAPTQNHQYQTSRRTSPSVNHETSLKRTPSPPNHLANAQNEHST